MREKYFRFMQGRYGIDALGRFLIYSVMIFSLLNLLFGSLILFTVDLAIWSYAFYRVFSKDIYKRSMENNRYLNFKACISGKIKRFFNRFRQGGNAFGDGSDECGQKFRSKCNSFSGKCYDDTYKVFKCPKCRQKLRVPRGKGKIMITCRRCQYEFIKRT